PSNERVGIIQTPYSAYRGRRSHLERLAGATTDVQHIVHQGLTAFDATFWVGANAVIRWALLADLRTVETVDGHDV
ncbi:glycosyltransferase family 2 protein, partial [Klebsiella pneumoniae]|uniref:glycosyltransferase family 2 protein n=1 Tax=Klebsiella pneumoniae TaxID=573 RepID=UPI003EE180A8